MAAFCWMLIAWKELVSAPRLQWNVHTTVFGLLAGGGSASAGAPDNNERDTAAATEIARMSFMTPSLRPRTYILETPAASLIRRPRAASLRPLGLSQHADQHGPKGPVLLAVDQEFGEGATLRVAPELADRISPVEVGKHEDVEQFGEGSGAEGVEAIPESAVELIGSHGSSVPSSLGRRYCSSSLRLGHPRSSLCAV
jgi:hypothetical protein